MTDIDLQKTIRNELQKMKLKIPADEGADGKKTKWQEIPIYLQNKPYSHDEAYDYGDPLCDDKLGRRGWIITFLLLSDRKKRMKRAMEHRNTADIPDTIHER